MSALLETRGLRTGYGRLPVVFDIDLEVHEGEIVTLLGANGAGKTTTLRALSGLLPLMGGEIRLDGESLAGTAATRSRAAVSSTSRRGADLPQPEGRGDAAARLRDGQDPAVEGRRPVHDMYDVFGPLHKRRSQLAGTLSGGEQQMLAIARGLIMRPRVLMIDEMSQGLAPKIVHGACSRSSARCPRRASPS